MQNPYQASSDKLSLDVGDTNSETDSFFEEGTIDSASCSLKSEPVSKIPIYASPKAPPSHTFEVMGTFVDNNGVIFGHLLEGGNVTS